MRDIKFRTWDKVLNKMITQENVDKLLDKINSKEWEAGFPYSSDEWYPAYQILGIFDYFKDIQKLGIKRYEPSENRFEIMQYTGLKDKNGKEIYEGDIVAEKGHYVNSDRLVYQKIQWKENYSCWLRGEYQRLTPKNIKTYQIEVVGNIYDNPELLED